MGFQIKSIEYKSAEYAELMELRHKVLREPLGLHYTQEQLESEKNDLFLAVFDEKKIVACCVLVKLSENELRIRHVAVSPEMQGKGLGSQLMSFVENYAKQNNFSKLKLHARESAVRFYEKLNYEKASKPFIEVGMNHWLMEKLL